MQKSQKPVIFLMGPTASGKTAMAVELVKRYPFEIINVDSAQVYRTMDIGSGKLDAETLAQAPHRLLDIRDPSEPYSAADFVQEALNEIEAIHADERIPLLVGGTMLYFKSLMQGLNDLPQADTAVRERIQAMADQEGWQAVHRELAKVDAESAARLHPNDQQRVQRALEVYWSSGKTMTEHRQSQANQRGDWSGAASSFPYPLLSFALAPLDRKVLHAQIEQRFEQMLQAGLEQEVRRLRERGDLHLDLPAVRSVGYRQMWEYLDGVYDAEQMRLKAVAATRQLAKRQITWLRSWPDAIWVDSQDKGALGQVCEKVDQFLGLGLEI